MIWERVSGGGGRGGEGGRGGGEEGKERGERVPTLHIYMYMHLWVFSLIC